MNSKTLSKEALNIIKEYKEMEISGIKISCPYFINKGQKIRAGLKVMIGKGSPKDIKEERDLKKLDKSNYAVYGFILFSILLAMLFVLKLKKQNKDEIE